MQVGITAQISTAQDVAFVREAERLGAASVWVPETWAQDAFTPLAYLAGHTTTIRLGTSVVQLGARSPANLAMSALSLQLLSGGRFTLGIGVSGPQVMEGWHGVRFGSPLAATRETIEIVRTIARGFAGAQHRSWAEPSRWQRPDTVLLAVGLVVGALPIVLNVTWM